MQSIPILPTYTGPIDGRTVGTLAERTTKAQPLYNGLMYWATDTLTLHIYTGTQWLTVQTA